MIRFTCGHCEQKIRVADTAAGKKGRCPHCKQPVTVPELISLELLADPPESPLKLVDPDVGDAIQLQSSTSVQDHYEDPFERRTVKISDVTDEKPKRLLPIFLDVFLFPLNKSGLMMLAAFTLAPIILYPVAFLGIFGPILYLGTMVCVWAYMFWYFSLCIHTSAEGNVRAPDTFNQDVNTSMGDMVLQMLRTILLIIVCLLPAFIFRVLTDSAGAVFYSILAAGIFFLPMMLLASILFDSFWAAWNPRIILGGMFSSILGYIVLVLAFYIPVGLYFYISQLGRSQENFALAVLLNGCSIYLIMVSSHLLGWFFYKNEEKLYWSV